VVWAYGEEGGKAVGSLICGRLFWKISGGFGDAFWEEYTFGVRGNVEPCRSMKDDHCKDRSKDRMEGYGFEFG
jgi:hypothetical protein